MTSIAAEGMSPVTEDVTDESNKIMHTAMNVARIYYQNHIKDPVAKEYLAKRALQPNAVYKFQLGYAPDDWRGLVDHYSYHTVRLAAKEAGLIGTLQNSERMIDFFRGRLMFPIKNDQGTLVGYAGRLLESREGSPKYINTPETELFSKGDILYGLHENSKGIDKSGEAILVEGYMDVITMATYGVDLGVAPMGTALTPNQFALILKKGVKTLFLCLDGDPAGIKATQRTLSTIMEQYDPRVEIRVMQLPDGLDPDDLILQRGIEFFLQCKNDSIPLADFIHNICTAGHRNPPCLEDRAEYLHLIKEYTEQASGPLYSKLFSQALAYTKLPPKDLATLIPSPTAVNAIAWDDKAELTAMWQANNERLQQAISERLEGVTLESLSLEELMALAKQIVAQAEPQKSWDHNTALAARWLVHDTPIQQQIAEKLSGVTLKSSGLDQLSSLAKEIQTGSEPTGMLYQYAQAHGPLSPVELTELRGNWQSWMKRAAAEDGIHAMAKNPHDESAKRMIKMALR